MDKSFLFSSLDSAKVSISNVGFVSSHSVCTPYERFVSPNRSRLSERDDMLDISVADRVHADMGVVGDVFT